MLLSIGMLMLSATQIYTILTVQLFAFLNLLPVEADILAYNLENGTQTFDDLPARFGYRLPAEGLKNPKLLTYLGKPPCHLPSSSEGELLSFTHLRNHEYHKSREMLSYSVCSLYGPKISLYSIVDVALLVSKQYAKTEADVKVRDCNVVPVTTNLAKNGCWFNFLPKGILSLQKSIPQNKTACLCCWLTFMDDIYYGQNGFLINSKPENACEPIAPPPLRDNSSGAFIVLIRRLECNFDIKVLNAQRAGYKAAIVHNVDSDDLISMGSNDIEILKKIDIPSVFIGETSANSLKEEFTYEKGGHVVLIPEFSLPLEYYLIPFLIIVGICLILIVIFMITKFVQDRHRARRNRLRKDQLKKIPVHKFKKGDEYDVCAICLDEYEDGDKLRILPCSHAYHCKCVDPWLTKTKKTCPVCKQKVVPSQGDSDSETDSSQEENEVSENTPLLRPLASVSTQSFGALSESHSHQNMTESSEYEEDDNDNIDSSDAENGVNEESVVVQLQPNDEREYRVANTV